MIYTNVEIIPKDLEVINDNDAYFSKTLLDNSEFCRNVLDGIDKAEYNSGTTFISTVEKQFGAQYKENLSTGTKTLLNIYKHPDMCFNVVECGNNCWPYLLKLHKGIVLWKEPRPMLTEHFECDILMDGERFSYTEKLVERIMEKFK